MCLLGGGTETASTRKINQECSHIRYTERVRTPFIRTESPLVSIASYMLKQLYMVKTVLSDANKEQDTSLVKAQNDKISFTIKQEPL